MKNVLAIATLVGLGSLLACALRADRPRAGRNVEIMASSEGAPVPTGTVTWTQVEQETELGQVRFGRDYDAARNHKWYMSARQICLNDLYAFDPDTRVEVEDFEDVIGRHFKQPAEGLGNDNTPASHMWRTLRRPANAL